MIKHLKSLLLLLFSIIPLNIYAEIIPTYSINSNTIQKLLPEIDVDTLVLINIDNTIITPKSKLFRYNDNPYFYFIDNLYSLANDYPKINIIIAELIKQRQIMLVESHWPSFINKMKAQGAMVFGFTQITKPNNLIDNYPGWLYMLLKGFNINFINKINDQETFRFDKKDPSSPIFYLGIIFAGSVNKVKTLIQFLKTLPNIPKKIVVFENNKIELERLNGYLKTVDILYYGIEYLGWQQIPGSPDENVAKLQRTTLLNTEKWLEDFEAENMLKANTENE